MSGIARWDDRSFRIWHYSVSYRRLLLRSLRDDFPSRVDVLFSNVSYLCMPSDVDRLEISEATDFVPPDHVDLKDAPGRWYVLNGGVGYLHGTHCEWHEDDGNALTPSRFGPFRRTD